MDNSSSRKLQALAIISAIAVSVVAASSLFAFGGTSLNNNIPQAFSQESAAVSGSTTITVTGDASTILTPDQATIIVNM